MGTNWKIYYNKNQVSLQSWGEIILRFTKMIKSAMYFGIAKIHSVEELKELTSEYNDQFNEIDSNFEITNSNETLQLFSQPELYQFGIFKNFCSHKGDVIGMSIIRSNNNPKSSLQIHLPYLSKRKSITELIELIQKMNEPLMLNFRDDKQISEKITQLINVTFDDSYIDTKWTMKHSHYSYRVSSSKKSNYEGKQEKTFRPMSFQIELPDFLFGQRDDFDYNQLLIGALVATSKTKTTQVHSTTKNSTLAAVLVNKSWSIHDATVKINWTELIDIIDDKAIQRILKNEQSYIRIENNGSQEIEYFCCDYRMPNNLETEIRLEIDKRAEDDFKSNLFEIINEPLKYEGEE